MERSEEGPERRAARRVAFACEALCEGPYPDPLQPRLRDLSLTGAFLETRTALAVGSRLTLRFPVAGGEALASAEVVRATAEGVGVRFMEIAPGGEPLIESAIADATAGGY